MMNRIVVYGGSFNYEAEIEYRGLRYGSSEAAFQAQKCTTEEKMINIPDIEKERVQRIPKELQSSFFLKRLISEEQYSFFHTKQSNADEKSAWVWNMTGDTLAVFRRLYDRRAEKWIEFCTFQIEIQNNSEQHRVWLYTNNDCRLAPQIERAAKTINI